ncbi:hypothetical protein BKA70DRAFT_115852 [Coprinopsis sp. MPI-PUGE-AT-0042]|nr:hypothetical protein BKA70DRAFT_115852 [Coprinopsis sp. MPI-PUGE-AT-0042]
MPTRSIRTSIRFSQTVFSDHFIRPDRLHSARSSGIRQSRTLQPKYTWPGRPNRFGQESHVHVSTPAVHAQIAHEFCHGPITFPPLSEQASSRRYQWHSGKLPMPEGPRWLDLSCPALLHIADPTEHQAHAHPNGPRQGSLPEVTPAPTCGPGPIRPR